MCITGRELPIGGGPVSWSCVYTASVYTQTVCYCRCLSVGEQSQIVHLSCDRGSTTFNKAPPVSTY